MSDEVTPEEEAAWRAAHPPPNRDEIVERLQAENAALRAELEAHRQRGSGARIWHVTDEGRRALADCPPFWAAGAGALADIGDRDEP